MADQYRRRRQQSNDLATRLLGSLGQSLWNVVSRPWRTRQRATFNQLQYRQRWQQVETLASNSSDVHWRQAVLEGDTLVDQALKELGLAGESFADRLRAGQGRLPSDLYNKLWAAHKLRNQIAHEADFSVSLEQTRQALDGFERALSRLGAL